MTDEEKLELLNNRSEFNKHNGIVVTALGEGTSTVETELSRQSMNPWGSAHGGLLFALCDVAAGVAANGLKADGVTQSGSLYYLRPASSGKLKAVAAVIKGGKKVALVETNVYDDQGNHVARGEFEYFKVGPQKILSEA